MSVNVTIYKNDHFKIINFISEAIMLIYNFLFFTDDILKNIEIY